MTAMLVTDFDIEILADKESREYCSDKWGLGARRIVDKLPFRIRKRDNGKL